ncbi:expressed unknown protein [Seminavis robusta]|uniref:MYND-type domain-containing protein n=1 Tax=Seminavis robusta TaxID=568900 RepID=A0A9N8HNJ5_9STRA|nr:expressed unknown protein [Seminavis robusta]|eukprot:Sro1221_g253670.1 n/a (556) ;mRNA; r:14842-16509
MGKKSKRTKAKANTRTTAPLEDLILECPENGWIQELSDAKKVAKETPTGKNSLRMAMAACKVRQWDSCLAAAKFGLSLLEPNDDETKKQLLLYQKWSNEELAKESQSMKHQRNTRDLIKEIKKEDVAIDYIQTEYETFDNLNLLQYSGILGDVALLEELVALGAAIDFPVLTRSTGTGTAPATMGSAPEGTTALTLLCATLAVGARVKKLPGGKSAKLQKVHQGILQCAMILVKSGANCSLVFGKPDRPPAASADPYHFAKLYGKSAQELAKISGNRDLIQAMKEFEDKEHKIANAFCRCGSRLPWKQCHAGDKLGQSPIYFDGDDGTTVYFRYSPLAPCCCKSGKTYWKCCWVKSSNPKYQDDATGELTGDRATRDQAVIQSLMNQIQVNADGTTTMFPAFEGMSGDEIRDSSASFIRSSGLSKVAEGANPKSKIMTWDPEVYAGCMERLDEFFYWNDIHWQLDKGELLKRVKEWNHALNQYCDDKGLQGRQREQIVQCHSASPYAPCANPECTAFESRAKEFGCCPKCKSVSYCSHNCQKSAWREHKKQCLNR